MSQPEGPDIQALAALADVQVQDVAALREDLTRLMQLVDRLQAVSVDPAPPIEPSPVRREDAARRGRGRAVLAEAREVEKDHVVVRKP